MLNRQGVECRPKQGLAGEGPGGCKKMNLGQMEMESDAAAIWDDDGSEMLFVGVVEASMAELTSICLGGGQDRYRRLGVGLSVPPTFTRDQRILLDRTRVG